MSLSSRRLVLLVALLSSACTGKPSGSHGDGADVDEGDATDLDTPAGDDDGTSGDPSAPGDEDISPPHVALVDRALFVDGERFQIRGVCWNPVDKGDTHPNGIDFPRFVTLDAPLMQAAGINVVRTYETITDTDVLDDLLAHGIYVLNTVYAWGGSAANSVTAKVTAVGDHPAVLMWLIGNEWNYNGLYVGMSHADSLARLNEVATLIRAVDTTRPIATVYGEVPSSETVAAMPNIDAWGINAYRGISFGNLFTTWQGRSTKPMFLAEYGADAFNALPEVNAEDTTSQAAAVNALTEEILDNHAIAMGGTLFEWADEWWKDSDGTASVHDVGGVAPGGGPYPDATFNEEWWGIVTVERDERLAYEALADLYNQ